MKLPEYIAFIDTYYLMIDAPDWWDGRRDALVRLMDGVWPKLTADEREKQYLHQCAVYAKRIGG